MLLSSLLSVTLFGHTCMIDSPRVDRDTCSTVTRCLSRGDAGRERKGGVARRLALISTKKGETRPNLATPEKQAVELKRPSERASERGENM